jgi:hypothetical protein
MRFVVPIVLAVFATLLAITVTTLIARTTSLHAHVEPTEALS